MLLLSTPRYSMKKQQPTIYQAIAKQEVNYFLWKKRALTRELQVEELIPDGSELNVCPVFQEKKVKYRLLLRRAMLDQRQLN